MNAISAAEDLHQPTIIVKRKTYKEAATPSTTNNDDNKEDDDDCVFYFSKEDYKGTKNLQRQITKSRIHQLRKK